MRRVRNGVTMRTTLIVALLASTACAMDMDSGDDLFDTTSDRVDAEEAAKADRPALTLIPFTDDIGLAGQKEVAKVFTSASAYSQYFGHAAPRMVDWAHDWVVFYSAGERNTGGYAATIAEVTTSQTGRTLKVETALSSPGPNCLVTQAFTHPYALAKFKRPAPRPEFVHVAKTYATNDCAGPALVVSEDDNGKTIEVQEGREVVVELPANPSTGYTWVVTATDRTLGYPATTKFTPDSDAVGAAGVYALTWKTKGFLSLIGPHRVTLEYRRGPNDGPADPPNRSFSFVIDVTP